VRLCRCTPQQVERYRNRLSGPLRDRLDLTVGVPPVTADVLCTPVTSESSAAVRARVVAARERQRARYEQQGLRTNSELTPALMSQHCPIGPSGRRMLDAAIRRLGLTARGYDRTRRIARSIADLAGTDSIGADDVAEALQFRMPS